MTLPPFSVLTCFLLHNMTLRDNRKSGYDSDHAARGSRELRRENHTIRALRLVSEERRGEERRVDVS